MVCLWRVPGMPTGCPIDPKRHEKFGKKHKKYNKKTFQQAQKCTVAALRAALLDTKARDKVLRPKH